MSTEPSTNTTSYSSPIALSAGSLTSITKISSLVPSAFTANDTSSELAEFHTPLFPLFEAITSSAFTEEPALTETTSAPFVASNLETNAAKPAKSISCETITGSLTTASSSLTDLEPISAVRSPLTPFSITVTLAAANFEGVMSTPSTVLVSRVLSRLTLYTVPVFASAGI